MVKGGLSVITLVHERGDALANLVTGLNLGIRKPDELVIVFMNEKPVFLPEMPFPVKSIELRHEAKIPLANARNLGVENASCDNLIFLDVDCIPGKTLVKDFGSIIKDCLYCGHVRYLSQEAMHLLDFDELDRLSIPDPIRSTVGPLAYELFWSLNFACSRKTFKTIGGFNEDYIGYGAEDTDFAFRAKKNKVPLINTKVFAYHQYHPKYEPPLNHFEDIIKNAALFQKLWGSWAMEGWLDQFAKLDLINWDDEITINRYPSPLEIAAAIKKD